MFLLRQFGKSVLLAISTAALLIAGTPLFAAEAFGLVKRYVDLYEVNFPNNPSANASILIRKYVVAEDHPADWEWPENITSWSINVSGLHCMGNHQQPDGHAEWTRQASYGLYVNGLRMLTFNEGCARNQGYGDFQTVIEVLVGVTLRPNG